MIQLALTNLCRRAETTRFRVDSIHIRAGNLAITARKARFIKTASAEKSILTHPNLYHMKPRYLLVTIIFLASCGQSEKERTALLQAQKTRNDSILAANIQGLRDAGLQRSALGDSLTACTALLARQQKELAKIRTELIDANDELTRLRQTHPGRTTPDREPQVQNQELKIQSLLVRQISLQSELEHNQAGITQLKAQLATASR
jgi:hypothetical protein